MMPEPRTTATRCGRCSYSRFFSVERAGKGSEKTGESGKDRLRSPKRAGPPTDSEGRLVFWNRSNGKPALALAVPKPMARRQDLIVQEVEDEVLVYDEMTAQAHCLNLEAARVWHACDGQKTEDALASELGRDAEVV